MKNIFITYSILAGVILFSVKSFSGKDFSKQGNALYKSLVEELIKQRMCTEYQSCFEILQLYSDDGDRIYMNMYGQINTKISSIVISHFIKKGISTTDGMPITLRIFPKPKSEYVGLWSIFKKSDESIKLEINK
jgi:hypothetical protein